MSTDRLKNSKKNIASCSNNRQQNQPDSDLAILYSSLRQTRPRQWRKIVGMTLTTTIIAAPIPALGAMPTVSNIGENLLDD
jgi:hypothetical protein